MNTIAFKTRSAFLLPIFMDSLLLLILLIISLFERAFPSEPLILFLIFVLAFYICIGAARRKTTVGDEGIGIQKLFRRKGIRWDDITNVDSMVLHKKVYLLLTTTRGFHTVANSYGNFSSLVQEIVRHVDQEKVEEGVRDIIAHPLKRISDIVSAWVAFIILLGAIVLKII